MLSEATYQHDDIRVPIHLSAHQAGEAAREAKARRLMLTHLWPTLDPVASVEEASEAFGDAVTLAAPHLSHAHLNRRLNESTVTDTRIGPRRRRICARSRSPATTPRWRTGSVLVEFGRTRVLCTASVEERVPPWLKGSGKGWVTAEYSMLPGSSPERVEREAAKGKQSGRTQEIQRLIGRSLRAVTDLRRDARRADHRRLRRAAGRRRHAHRVDLRRLDRAARRVHAGSLATGALATHPVLQPCAAISVGVIDGTPMLDLEYTEDVRAEVDMNVVMTGDGRFVEVQGTAEGVAFTRAELDALLELAEAGIAEIIAAQQEMVAERPAGPRAR